MMGELSEQNERDPNAPCLLHPGEKATECPCLRNWPTDAATAAQAEHIADPGAENARLQAALTEAGRVSDGLHAAVLMGSKHTEALERKRDGYKALAERRGEALNKGRWLVALRARTTMIGEDLAGERPACVECDRWLDTEGHHESCHWAATIAWLASARAAIDASPEAREKEKEMAHDPSCYVCGHAPEEHRNGDSECEFEDGCDCICFEAREGEDEDGEEEARP